MKNCFSIIIISLFVFASCDSKIKMMDLSGQWEIALDSLDTGISENWFDRDFSDHITLPGTLCDAGYGIPCDLKPAMEELIFRNLKRKYDYVGVAWYRKNIEIPEKWNNKSISLHLERVIWNSQIWVDGKKIDFENESLTTPHVYDLTNYLSPGKHVLTIRVDNRKQHDTSYKEMAHAYTNETQTLWNGIIGDIVLKAKAKTNIRSITLTPDIDNSGVHVKVQISNDSPEILSGEIHFHVKEKGGKSLAVKKIEISGTEISFDYTIENPKFWDEFNPNLYEAVAELKTKTSVDKEQCVFGMRKLTNKNALLQINDRRLFLRGTLECCIFPLKGYPPMDKAGWKKIFGTACEYGLNHIRFHSWCPPEAAFEAADEMGIYLQVELPVWELNIGNDSKTTDFLFAEARKIMQEYGNHPSFCFWSMGNELEGNFAVIDSLMMFIKKQDSRHLYTTTTFTFKKGHGAWPESNDDFWITQWTKKGWIRGQGIFDSQPVNFNKDFSSSIDSLHLPVISHEIGQYSVFPDLKEIPQYNGNLIPLNLIAIQEDLKKKGRLEQANDFLMSSGKLAVILYKEEIERALKTPGFSGFQLLDLHDFPGQGTALVGLLNSFWESKGLITPETFRTFCAPIVPLVRFEKATYINSDTLHVEAEIANFSDKTLDDIIPVWQLQDSKGQTIAQGELPKQNIPVGNAFKLGNFSILLSSIQKAEKLSLVLSINNKAYYNSWDIWVYPEKLQNDARNVFYTRNFNEAAQALAQGKKVLLNPLKEDINGLEGKFVQVFWSPVHFPNQPGTMGVLCDPKHPALSGFPTEMHSNWQWWDICKNAVTMNLDSIPQIKDPIVRMLDNFYKNRNLGLIFEAQCGNGKLLLCSVDLEKDIDKRPVSRQLLFSLTNYMESADFRPEKEIAFELIEKNIYKHIKQ